LGVIFAAVAALPARAQALEVDVTLRFLPSQSPGVTGYRVYATNEVTQIEQMLDVGLVEPDPDGVARAIVVLDSETSFLVAMTAYSALGESERSNQIQIRPETTVCDPGACDDGRACTADSCDEAGCFHTPLPNGSVCDDGSSDTVEDSCNEGVCQGTRVVCREDFECDDGNVCNGLETCGDIACVHGVPLECGPPSACATPLCDSQTGCEMAPVADGTPCDDAIAGGVCLAGTCQDTGEDPLLSVDAVSPRVVSPGRHALTVEGLGFEPGATLRFENGKGRAPRVRDLLVVDGQTLLADVEVSHSGPKRSRFWDLVVNLPDQPEARLVQGVRIDP
jgi:hypothetical protein